MDKGTPRSYGLVSKNLSTNDFWIREASATFKTTQAISNPVTCPGELDGKILSLKTPRAWPEVIENPRWT